MEEPADGWGWSAPTVDDLNGDSGREFDQTGVRDTSEEDLARLEPDTDAGLWVARSDQERLREPGIRRMMVMDVRGDAESDERRGWRRR